MKAHHNFAKIISMVLVLCMMLSFVSCDAIKGIFGGSLKLESFTVDRSSVKTDYFIGEELDFSGIKVVVSYSDDALNAELTFNDVTIKYDDNITATVGQKLVTVTYNDPNLEEELTAYVQINVTEDPNVLKHDSYKLDTSNVKTQYLVGETVDLTGLKLIEVMSDKSEVEVTDLTALDFGDLSTATATVGNKTYQATYNGEVVNGALVIRVVNADYVDNTVAVGGSFKTTYDIGASLDLTGLTITITYENDEVVTLTHESLTAGTVDMSKEGTKTIIVSFTDPINSVEDFVYVNIEVLNRSTVVGYEKNAEHQAFLGNNASASKDSTASNFYGTFADGNTTYKIGDDNEFRFVPDISVEKSDGTIEPLAAFHSVVKLSVWNGESFVECTKTAVNATNCNYTLDGEDIASVDTFNGKYQFKKNGIKVQISVAPSAEYYIDAEEWAPVTLDADIIDAYNVYEDWQLAVIDNSGRQEWKDIKIHNGIADVNPAGIVLHNNIDITYSSAPSTFFYHTDAKIEYKDTVETDANGDPIIWEYSSVTGHNYLIDGTVIYEHIGSDFKIEGNMFEIDASDFPIVASPSIFGDGERDYGGDYSNACLFMFESITSNWVADSAATKYNYEVNNLKLTGNAGRDGWVIYGVDGYETGIDDELVTAGGLIMLKSSRHANTTINNCVNKCFFISYFPDYQGKLTVNNSKCSDSYQNGAFVWSDVTLNLNDTYINGTGGPVIVSMSVEENSVYYNPVVNINGGNVSTSVSGQEIWFTAVNATSKVAEIVGLGQLLQAYSLGNIAKYVDAGGGNKVPYMNIKAILMPKGNSADVIAAGGAIEGTINTTTTVITGEDTSVVVNGGFERVHGTAYWDAIYSNPSNPYFHGGAAFLTVYDADGNAHTIFMDSATSFAGVTAEVVAAFQNATEVVLHQQGLSAILELYH